jgi:hypothetical protein
MQPALENRMSLANNDYQAEKTSPLIEKLRRHRAAAGNDAVPASVYETHDAHWSAKHATRPYVLADEQYQDYAPAYLYGVVWYYSNPERQFDASEGELATGWEAARGDSPLDWPKAKPAVREAWYEINDLAERAKLERDQLLARSPTAPTPGDH